MSIDNAMAAYAYYGITTPEDEAAASELESEGEMKAKDYAKQFNDSPTDETLADIAISFLKECHQIAQIRHAKTDYAMFSIFNEQDKKWRAFAGLTDGTIAPDGFAKLIKAEFPGVFTSWQEYNLDARRPA